MMGFEPLVSILTKLISDNGPISFEEFMQVALYEPAVGYYFRNIPGAGSIYSTSPTITPAFGRLVAKDVLEQWHAFDKPDVFSVVEVGGGDGSLALSAVEVLLPSLGNKLNWIFVEPFDPIAAAQKDRMSQFGDRIRWVRDLDELNGVVGCIIANEVFDNFPVHVIEVTQTGLMEVYVAIEGSTMVEELHEINDPNVSEVADIAAGFLEDTDRFEVCSHIVGWFERAVSALERGQVLLIDYGDLEPEIWTRRPSGSLVTYGAGTMGTDPYDEIGNLDITAHVNFSAVKRAAEANGFDVAPLVSQRDWLLRLGIGEKIDDLRSTQAEAEGRKDHAGSLAAIAERSKLGAIIARGGLGELRVFRANKKIP